MFGAWQIRGLDWSVVMLQFWIVQSSKNWEASQLAECSKNFQIGQAVVNGPSNRQGGFQVWACLIISKKMRRCAQALWLIVIAFFSILFDCAHCCYKIIWKVRPSSNKAILGKKKHQRQAGLELGRLDQGRDRMTLWQTGLRQIHRRPQAAIVSTVPSQTTAVYQFF